MLYVLVTNLILGFSLPALRNVTLQERAYMKLYWLMYRVLRKNAVSGAEGR